MTLFDIDNPEELVWVEDVVESWMRVKNHCSQRLPDDTELVLEYRTRGYYLVSWTNQYIAWLADVDPFLITNGHRDPISQSHLGEYPTHLSQLTATNKLSRLRRKVRVLVRCECSTTLYAHLVDPDTRIISDHHRLPIIAHKPTGNTSRPSQTLMRLIKNF